MAMYSKQQDVYVVVKILSLPTEGWSDAGLSGSLLLSPSEKNAAVKRAIHCGLMRPAFGEETNRRLVACLDIHR